MRLRRALLLVLVVVIMALGIAGIAYADRVGGGTWYHGKKDGKAYSNYYHGSRCHSSAVYAGYWARSGATRAGNWAYASAKDRPYRVDKAYWNNSC